MFKKFHGDIESIDYDDLDKYDYNYDFVNDNKYRKLEALQHSLKSLKEIITNQ